MERGSGDKYDLFWTRSEGSVDDQELDNLRSIIDDSGRYWPRILSCIRFIINDT